MDPRVAHLETLLTALGVRVHGLDFLKVRAGYHGFFSPLKLSFDSIVALTGTRILKTGSPLSSRKKVTLTPMDLHSVPMYHECLTSCGRLRHQHGSGLRTSDPANACSAGRADSRFSGCDGIPYLSSNACVSNSASANRATFGDEISESPSGFLLIPESPVEASVDRLLDDVVPANILGRLRPGSSSS
jgi:hypothetical protein